VHEQEIRPTSVHTEEFLLVFLIDITVFVFSRHILRQNAWMLKLRLIKLKPKILPSSSNYGLVCCVKRFTSRGQSHEALLHCRLYWFTALSVGLLLLLKRMMVGHLPRPLSRTVTPPPGHLLPRSYALVILLAFSAFSKSDNIFIFEQLSQK